MQNLKSISHKLAKIGKKIYIVGWFTREKIMWHEYAGDIDLATDALPSEIAMQLNVIKEVWKKYGTMIVNEWDEVFEITTFRQDIWILNNRKPVEVEFTDSLDLDSARRDFTCNSIYYDIELGEYIDPQNGIDDIRNNLIRFVWNPSDRINEDALRILRYIRIKNKFWFENALTDTFEILSLNIWLLKNISIERIKEEFDKILLLKNNIEALNDLKTIWFFKIFLSDVDNLELTLWWPWHHLEWNVWVHTLMTIRELNNVFDNGLVLSDMQWNDEIIRYDYLEKLDFYRTMLLHDVSKYETYRIDENGNVHYYNHETLWAIKVAEILKKYKFPNNSSKKIIWLIQNHLRIFKVIKMRPLKSRKLMMHKYFRDLILVWIADHLGRIPADALLIDELKLFYKQFMIILKDKVFYKWWDID